jgi:hypothetical protein
MTDSERKILIRHYAKVIVEHNLLDDDLRDTIARMAQLQKGIDRARDGQR